MTQLPLNLGENYARVRGGRPGDGPAATGLEVVLAPDCLECREVVHQLAIAYAINRASAKNRIRSGTHIHATEKRPEHPTEWRG